MDALKPIPCVKFFLCLTSYCIYCLENFVKYITKNAYIQISLSGTPFFHSAFNSFVLITKNAHRFAIAGSIGKIYMFFGLMIVSSSVGFYTAIMLTNIESLELTSPLAPLLCMLVIAATISTQFLSVFSYSTDAILQAFLLDEELKFSG